MGAAEHLRTYSVGELEKIAAQELQKLREIRHFSIPIDIETIVEKFHEVVIDVHRGLKENHHLWGIVGRDLDTDKITILIDDQLLDLNYHLKLYRMTIAEEFGHVLLHREAIEKVKSAEDFKALQNHGDWDKHDRNAKRLAAALLMPAKNILDDSRILYEQMVSLVGYNNPEAIKKQIAHKLSEKYEVSVASMRFRLNEWPINVIDKIDNAMRDSLDFLD